MSIININFDALKYPQIAATSHQYPVLFRDPYLHITLPYCILTKNHLVLSKEIQMAKNLWRETSFSMNCNVEATYRVALRVENMYFG